MIKHDSAQWIVTICVFAPRWSRRVNFALDSRGGSAAGCMGDVKDDIFRDESRGKLTMRLWVCWRAESICMLTATHGIFENIISKYLSLLGRTLFCCPYPPNLLCNILSWHKFGSLAGNMAPFSWGGSTSPHVSRAANGCGRWEVWPEDSGWMRWSSFFRSLLLLMIPWFQGLWFRKWSPKWH